MIEPIQQIIKDEKDGEDSLLVGLLASASVGIMDAGCYVTRGKVFASSQTGNLLYLGIDISNGDFSQILKYTFPVLLFVVGISLWEPIFIYTTNRRAGVADRHYVKYASLFLQACFLYPGMP